MYTAVDSVASGKVEADLILGDTSGRLHTNTNLMEARYHYSLLVVSSSCV